MQKELMTQLILTEAINWLRLSQMIALKTTINFKSVSMGLTVSRQTAKNLTVNCLKGKFYRQLSKKQLSLAKVFQISRFQLLISDCVLSKNCFNWYN